MSATSAAAGPNIVAKLSTAKMFGTLPKPDKATPLFQLIGIAVGVKHGNSTYGEWTAFTGDFEARSLYGETAGQSFRSGKLFTPSAVTPLLLTALATDTETGEIPKVQFALEIGYQPAKNPIGYEYTVRPLVKMSGADPLAALRVQLLALAASAPGEAAPADAPVPAKKGK